MPPEFLDRRARLWQTDRVSQVGSMTLEVDPQRRRGLLLRGDVTGRPRVAESYASSDIRFLM